MLASPLFVAMVLCAAELSAPAVGSVKGPWALPELGLNSNVNVGSRSLGGLISLVGGVGFEVDGVRFSSTAAFKIASGVNWPNGIGMPLSSLGLSPLALALAMPDVVNDAAFTGIRLTPVLGMTIPTGPTAFSGFDSLTTMSAALQLERRFGNVEFAYRIGGASSPCASQVICVQTWELINSVFVEGWVRPQLSLAFGASWSMKWLVLEDGRVPISCGTGTTCGLDFSPEAQPNGLASARVLINWAFSELFGAAFELNGALASKQYGLFAAGGGSLSFWFRSDQLLARNWLDR